VRDRLVTKVRGLLSLVRGDALLLFSMLLIVLCIWGFVGVAYQIARERTQKLDESLILSFRDPEHPSRLRGPAWLPGTLRDLTALGSPAVLVTFVLVVAGALLVRRQLHALVLVLVATSSGPLLNTALKDLFERPRPDLRLHLTEVSSSSFPSGHAMDSAVIYFTLAALLARFVRPRSLKLYFLAVAALLTFLAGLSRVCLGVHYPSDVLAGWSAGLGWAALCWLLANRLQRQGSVEPAK
jgi:undecaprenyl-diphosphatase